MPLQATSGAASYDAFGGGVPVVPTYIEDVFSTYVYTGTSASLAIVNGIDLAGKGGLVWSKWRSGSNAFGHAWFDTARGSTKQLQSQTAAAETTESRFTSFNSNGYTLSGDTELDYLGDLYASWTFRKQPKFFDVVTYTGTGANRTVAHALGSVPGCIMVKRTDTTGNWQVYHRANTANPETDYLVLNDTAATADSNTRWNDTLPTDTVFSLGTDATVNASGGTYVAYLWAHDAGGFGLTGTDNVISCGSFTTDGSGNGTVNLGYEPQWVMVKSSSVGSVWYMHDTMRGFDLTTYTRLFAQSSQAEATSTPTYIVPTSTGFNLINGFTSPGVTFIYIAIRRGPMKVPTDATKVFLPYTTAASTGTAVTTNFPVDFQLYKYRAGIDYWFDVDRLRGVNSTTTANSTKWLDTTATTAEASATNVSRNWGNTGFEVPGIVGGASNVFYSFQRAPSFMDVVCYTGTGSDQTLPHNLGAVPQLMITKNRSNASNWRVYDAFNGPTKRGSLNDSQAWDVQSSMWNDTAPTSTVFTVGTSNSASSQTYVIYLFTTCAGVSKVGSYTGTGTTKQIDCGFTAGARFVLIKRTDSTGDWYVWDSARGIIAGNDPYLLLNSAAAEVTSTDYIDTYSAGFEISSTAPAAINASGGNFVFLAIA